MAPMHTVREAVTKPWTNWLSPPRSALAFSQAPRRSILSSRSIHSPTNVPRARAKIMPRVSFTPVPARAPPSARSRPGMAPAAPMNTTARPMVRIRAPCHRSGSPPFSSSPSPPPARMASTLASVPSPIIKHNSFLSLSHYSGGQSPCQKRKRAPPSWINRTAGPERRGG